MLAVDQDYYNKEVSNQELQHSYRLFKAIISRKQNENSRDPSSTIAFKLPTDEELLSEELNNQLQRTIHIDVHRTRSLNFNKILKQEAEQILAYFVRVHKIEYKQGLNQIVGPFVIFRKVGASLSQCYEMFYKFFWKFSLNLYLDQDFSGLQMFFKMTTILLKYHSPSLSRYLEVNDIQPQIYALSWLMTLFSSKLSFQMTHLLWQYLFLDGDKYFLFFIVVGIIIWRKDSIIQSKNHSIFKIVTDMIFKTPQELEEVIKISLVLRKDTPFSLTQFFKQKMVFERRDSFKQNAELLSQITNLKLFLVLPKQIQTQQCQQKTKCSKSSCCNICQQSKKIDFFNNNQQFIQQKKFNNELRLRKLIHLTNNIKSIKKVFQFVILDLRKQKTKLNSKKNMFYIDVVNESFDKIQSDFLNIYMEQMYSKHFVFLLTGFTIDDLQFSDKDQLKCAKQLIGVLNSYSFPHLGILQGGYTALSIYEQQFKLKKQIHTKQKKDKKNNQENQRKSIYNNSSISSNNSQQPQPQPQPQAQNFKILTQHNQQPFKMNVKCLYSLYQLFINKRIEFFRGTDNIIAIVSERYLVFFHQVDGFQLFITHLQHNCSIIPYFLSHFGEISSKILKIIPISQITKLSYKAKSQNTIVIKFIGFDNMKDQKNINEKEKDKEKDNENVNVNVNVNVKDNVNINVNENNLNKEKQQQNIQNTTIKRNINFQKDYIKNQQIQKCLIALFKQKKQTLSYTSYTFLQSNTQQPQQSSQQSSQSSQQLKQKSIQKYQISINQLKGTIITQEKKQIKNQTNHSLKKNLRKIFFCLKQRQSVKQLSQVIQKRFNNIALKNGNKLITNMLINN